MYDFLIALEFVLNDAQKHSLNTFSLIYRCNALNQNIDVSICNSVSKLLKTSDEQSDFTTTNWSKHERWRGKSLLSHHTNTIECFHLKDNVLEKIVINLLNYLTIKKLSLIFSVIVFPKGTFDYTNWIFKTTISWLQNFFANCPQHC